MYYGKLKSLNCGKITARGWLKEQLERSKNGMGGHLDELDKKMFYDPYINKSTTNVWGLSAPGWGAEIAGHYWVGLITLAFTLPDKELQKKAEDWVNKVLAVQDDDGYLGTYTKNDDRTQDFNAFGNAYGMQALLLYYEATGRRDVFDAVYKGLLWFCRTTEWHFTAYAGSEILKLMSYCYRETGDKELLDFCYRYEDYLNNPDNDTYRVGMKAFSDNDLFYNQNHAAAYATLVSRPAAVYLADGDPNKLNASVKGLEKLHKKCLLVNGGISGNAEWLSPISAVAETEYCTTAYMATSYAYFAAATGKAIYGDYLERTIFNIAQGARKKDEKAITYFTAPNQLCATDHSSQVHDPHGMYAPVFSTSCCSANSVVIMPEFVKNLALEDENSDLHIVAYAPCRIQHKNAMVEIETFYPFRKDIIVKITSNNGLPIDFSLYFKKPYWCDEMNVCAGSKTVWEVNEDGFIKVSGPFESGSKINIRVSMKPEIIELDDTDGADKHPLSVSYGPLCFCLPVKEKWIDKGNGYAQTELPDGWSWYEVQKDFDKIPLGASVNRLDAHSWNFATTKQALEENLMVTEEETDGYVWENPMLTISVNGWHAPYLYNNYTPRTNEQYGKTVPISYRKTVKLVPYGCTVLRITCFAKACTD